MVYSRKTSTSTPFDRTSRSYRKWSASLCSWPCSLSHTHCSQPELLSGTLRQNLDPFEELDDAVLNDALRSAGLFSLQRYTDEGQITLDTQIASGGNNLSFGQKQILALARAIVRQSKLLILDEGMSIS